MAAAMGPGTRAVWEIFKGSLERGGRQQFLLRRMHQALSRCQDPRLAEAWQ